MSLPWEAEKIVNAFNRAHSMSLEIVAASKDYVEGIKTTVELLPFEFARVNLVVPNEETVRNKLMAKTAVRLERLMKELVKHVKDLDTQVEIMRGKIVEIEGNKEFGNANVVASYYSMKKYLQAAEKELEGLLKASCVSYFR